MKAVFYTVKYGTDFSHYTIQEIVVDLTIGNVDLCGASEQTPANIKMEFGIKFVPYQA